MTRAEVFRQIRAFGGVKAVVSFSGGNDEGYVEGVSIQDAADQTLRELSEDRPGDFSEFVSACVAPVYDKYGSFAGDFSVSGSVTFDALKQTATMDYEESEYVSHSDEL